MTFTAQEALQRTIDHREIFYDEMLSLMRQIMAGEISPVMTAAILTGLRVKKETIGEIAAAATVMRELSTKVVVPPPNEHFLDVVGTGGDGSHTFNISTATIFVAAAAGARVAKHGGRSVSSKSGSADVLEALGVNLNLKPEQVAECIEETGIGFMFAPNHHPAMKNVERLGAKHVLVVYGRDSMDEVSLGAATMVGELKNGQIREYEIHPEDFGLTMMSSRNLKVADAAESKAMLLGVLDNQPGAAREIVALNAGTALYTANVAGSIREGILLAREVLASSRRRGISSARSAPGSPPAARR